MPQPRERVRSSLEGGLDGPTGGAFASSAERQPKGTRTSSRQQAQATISTPRLQAQLLPGWAAAQSGQLLLLVTQRERSHVPCCALHPPSLVSSCMRSAECASLSREPHAQHAQRMHERMHEGTRGERRRDDSRMSRRVGAFMKQPPRHRVRLLTQAGSCESSSSTTRICSRSASTFAS